MNRLFTVVELLKDGRSVVRFITPSLLNKCVINLCLVMEMEESDEFYEYILLLSLLLRRRCLRREG